MQMYVLVMQVSFMMMQMQMYVFVMYMLVMHGFAPAWYCGCKCNQMMVQMEIVCFANILQKDAYVNVCMWCKCLNQYSWKFKNSLQHFCSKSRLSCLILNFGDHHHEFFRVRSIWCFKKFSSMSLDLFSKISQFDWKWDIWKFFLGLAHEFSTIEHCEKNFVWVNFKQIQCSFKILNIAF